MPKYKTVIVPNEEGKIDSDFTFIKAEIQFRAPDLWEAEQVAINIQTDLMLSRKARIDEVTEMA